MNTSNFRRKLSIAILNDGEMRLLEYLAQTTQYKKEFWPTFKQTFKLAPKNGHPQTISVTIDGAPKETIRKLFDEYLSAFVEENHENRGGKFVEREALERIAWSLAGHHLAAGMAEAQNDGVEWQNEKEEIVDFLLAIMAPKNQRETSTNKEHSDPVQVDHIAPSR